MRLLAGILFAAAAFGQITSIPSASGGGGGAPTGAAGGDLSGTYPNPGVAKASSPGAASAPAFLVTGTWFSGGTATTTKPQALVECKSGTTVSASWNTTGTGLGINACSGFAGYLLDLQNNGSGQLYVNNSGILHANAVRWGANVSSTSGTMEYDHVELSSAIPIGFSSTTNFALTIDVGLDRDSSGVIGVIAGNAQTTTAANYRDLKLRHLLAAGTAPTITSGFGTSPAITGFDSGGRLTVGTGGVATTGVITFGTAYTTNAPACVANNETTIALVQATATITTLTLTASAAFAAGALLTWHCTGY